MARKVPPIKLSSFVGGVNTTEAEGRGALRLSPDRAVEALNVEEVFGYIKRRPAFKAICHGPQHILPAGQVWLHYNSSTSYDRTISFAGSSIASGFYFYIGCDTLFDGISIPELSITTTGFTSHGYIKVEWASSSSTWVEHKGVVDFTRGRCVNGSNVWIHTLTQPGTIAWCRNNNDPEVTSSETEWTAVTPSGLPASKYWVRLSIVDAGGTAKAFGSSDTLTIPQPGVHCFQLEPVNSILPAKLKSGKSAIFFSGDRQSIRGRERGALLSTWTQLNKSPKLGFKVDDWGAGVWDAQSFPSVWKYYTGVTALGAKRTWPTDFSDTANTTADWLYADPDTSSLTKTARLVKSDQSYAWSTAQKDSAAADAAAEFRGGCLHYRIIPTSVTENNTTTKRCTMVFGDNSLGKNLEHCFIRVAVSGGGPAVGEESQILSHSGTTVTCYPEFSAIPVAATTEFNIYSPHAKAQYGDGSYVSDYICYNFPHYIHFNPEGAATTWPFNWAALTSGWYHFYIGRELNWTVDRGDFWTSAYDPLSQKHLMTNGKSGLLSWDGKNFEQVAALTDPNSAVVQLYLQTAGAFDDPTESIVETGKIALGELCPYPPNGQYVVAFNSKIVVAGERMVYWSVAYDNTIWPRNFKQELRDPYGNNITGLEVLGDRIVVFTPTAVFSSPGQDQGGRLNFQIESTGMGFTSGRAVAKLFMSGSPALLGPTADGVRIYSPGSSTLTPVMESWTEVLAGGVNTGLLDMCVGAVSKLENRYYLAVPRAGFTHLDTILVWDMSTKAWWVWKFPGGGIASISRDFDETGRERMLFGGNNGIVFTLAEKDNDDTGEYSTQSVPWRVVSPPIDFKGNTIAPTSILLRGDESTASVTVTTYLNGRVTEDDSSVVTFADGSDTYGSGVYGTATFASDGEQVLRLNLPTGTRCTSFQYKLSGTGRFTFKGAELLANVKGQRSK